MVAAAGWHLLAAAAGGKLVLTMGRVLAAGWPPLVTESLSNWE